MNYNESTIDNDNIQGDPFGSTAIDGGGYIPGDASNNIFQTSTTPIILWLSLSFLVGLLVGCLIALFIARKK